MTDRSPEEQLVKYLTDAHSIEEQALTQLRRAPDIAGDPRLAQIFAEHLEETERHERRVRERLEALDASPSKVKDLAGQAGGLGMVLFARSQPDTPGKLTAHAYSYEHLEAAAYELLRGAAAAAGDSRTERMAIEIAGEERDMAARLESCFDAAVQASLREKGGSGAADHLDGYLTDAHAIEHQALSLLKAGPGMVRDAALAKLFEEHLDETREHVAALERRLEARGASPSRLQDLALAVGGLNVGAFFGAQPDTTPKLAGFAFAFEHLEIAGYELLTRVASRAGDDETVQAAQRILVQERAAADNLNHHLGRLMGEEMGRRTGAAEHAAVG